MKITHVNFNALKFVIFIKITTHENMERYAQNNIIGKSAL